MKRRSFLKCLLASATAPVVAKDIADFDFDKYDHSYRWDDKKVIERNVDYPDETFGIRYTEPDTYPSDAIVGSVSYSTTTGHAMIFDGKQWVRIMP